MRTTVGNISLGPEFTANVLKFLIMATSVISLAIPFLDVLIGTIFKVTGLQFLFSLSWAAISHWLIWQPITYLFILQSHGGISFSLFISLAFRMYLLWILGSSLIERFGTGAFLRLYFGGGILAAFSILGAMAITGFKTIVSGNTASLFTIFVVWAMMNPKGIIYLFFLFPIPVKWLLLGAVGGNLLIHLSNEDGFGVISMIVAVGFGYMYATMAWGLHTPFPFTEKMDRSLSHFGDRIFELWMGITRKDRYSKVYQTSSQKKRLREEEFVDAMLEKISKHGEKSLWFWQRWRLRKISKKNQK